jgi:hypothetical protein
MAYAGRSNTQAAEQYASFLTTGLREIVFVDDERGNLFEAWTDGKGGLVPFGARGGSPFVRAVAEDCVVSALLRSWSMAPNHAAMAPLVPYPRPTDWVDEVRWVVTGGRAYDDLAGAALACDRVVAGAYRALQFPPRFRPVLAHGAAEGADRLADAWADARGVPQDQRLRFPVTQADYDRAGRRAPLERNDMMLASVRPHLVVALPGGNGTEYTVRAARGLGVPVWRPYGAARAPAPAAAKAPSKGGARARR